MSGMGEIGSVARAGGCEKSKSLNRRLRGRLAATATVCQGAVQDYVPRVTYPRGGLKLLVACRLEIGFDGVLVFSAEKGAAMEGSSTFTIAVLVAVVMGIAVLTILVRRGWLVFKSKWGKVSMGTAETTRIRGLKAGRDVNLEMAGGNDDVDGVEAGRDISYKKAPAATRASDGDDER
jgi:hypothetical protein